MSHKKLFTLMLGSYVKFYVESAKSHIGDIEKSPKLMHGPSKQNHCAASICRTSKKFLTGMKYFSWTLFLLHWSGVASIYLDLKISNSCLGYQIQNDKTGREKT